MQSTKTNIKTEILKQEDKKALKSALNKYPSITALALALNLPRHVVDVANKTGRTSPANATLIRQRLSEVA